MGKIISTITDSIEHLTWQGKCQITRLRMPSEVFTLLGRIHERYSELDLNGNGWPTQEDEKLSRLITIINEDAGIRRLESLQRAASLPFYNSVYELVKGEKTGIGGFGVDLCLGEDGLYVDDFNTYELKKERRPATPAAIAKYNSKVKADTLRRALVDYTEKGGYVKRLTWLRQMRNAVPAPLRDYL